MLYVLGQITFPLFFLSFPYLQNAENNKNSAWLFDQVKIKYIHTYKKPRSMPRT